MAKKEKGYLAGLSDEMVAAAKQYLFDMDGQTSPEMQRGEDFHKIIKKAHPATQPTLRAVAAKWIEDHMPIGAKTRPFDEANPRPWWEYTPEGEKKDVSAESRWIAEQAGLSREQVIEDSRKLDLTGRPAEELPEHMKSPSEPFRLGNLYGELEEQT